MRKGASLLVPLEEHFGYKCKLVRDIKKKAEVYECFFATEITSGLKKLQKADEAKRRLNKKIGLSSLRSFTKDNKTFLEDNQEKEN